jgi:hypothetical protein
VYTGLGNSPTTNSIRGSSANNLVLNAYSNGATYINYDTGTGGLVVCNGAQSNVAVISGTGIMTLPNQPKFQAFCTNATSTANYVIYNVTWLNIGSYYNTSTGRFTAPIAGTYFFSYCDIGNSAQDTYRLNLYINGSIYTNNGVSGAASRSGAYSGASANIYSAMGRTAMVTMGVGDYAQIYFSSDGGTSLYGDTSGYTAFNGYLIG